MQTQDDVLLHLSAALALDSPMQTQLDHLLRLPAVLTIVPVSRATWYAGVKSGRYPKPISLGPRCVAWRASDIQQLVSQGASALPAE
ncbi:AlpA family phage regulatory protein [Paraburkholderia sp. IMGN_8]|uniref:helix-turn-helix transcriptional regulator n=1 Tax=Paraburkholderia sp. IMGN_8 TaxID=3136564 RepID=UPI0031014180